MEEEYVPYRERRRARTTLIAVVLAFGLGGASAASALISAGFQPPRPAQVIFVAEQGPPWVPAPAPRPRKRAAPVVPVSAAPEVVVTRKAPVVTVRPRTPDTPPMH